MARSLLVMVLLASGVLCRASGPYQSLYMIDQASLDSLAAEGWVPVTLNEGENTRLIASGLAVLLGPFGAHRLYLGTTPKVAIIYGVTFGGFGILALLDLGHLLFTKDLSAYRNNDRVFMWGRKAATPP